MAGSINGLGGQQQAQLSTLQSGQNSQQVRQQDERQQPRENVVQPQNAAAASSQRTETSNQNNSAARERDGADARHANADSQERGSLVDISV